MSYMYLKSLRFGDLYLCLVLALYPILKGSALVLQILSKHVCKH